MIVTIAAALFALGLYGVLTRRDLVAILAAIEVMLTGVTTFIIGVGAARAALLSQVVVLVFLALAAAEAVVGIALVLATVRRTGLDQAEELDEVRG